MSTNTTNYDNSNVNDNFPKTSSISETDSSPAAAAVAAAAAAHQQLVFPTTLPPSMEVSKETKAMYPSRPMYPSTAAERAACAEYDAVAENKSAAKRAAANKRAALAELADAKEAMMLAEEKYNTAKDAAAVAAANAKDAEMADNPDVLLCGLTAQLAEDAAMAASEAEKMYNVAKAAVDAVVFPEEGENPYRECICGTDNECVKNGDCSACLGDDGYCDGGCGVTHCYISSRCSNWNIYIERCNPSSPAQYCHCK
jgi:hypothetical protein